MNDCKYINCIARVRMLNWIKKNGDISKENIKGIIKCNNPNCSMYFNYIDYKESIEYLGESENV